MGHLHRQNVATAGEVRRFPHGHVEVVELGAVRVERGTFEPGWRWSYDNRPTAGTQLCMDQHTAICLSGRMCVECDDGTETIIEVGDVVVIEPGHDAWTVGSQPCVLYDLAVGDHGGHLA